MAHKFVIKKTEDGQYRAYFNHNSESIFWTETCTSARSAVESIQKNGPGAPMEEA